MVFFVVVIGLLYYIDFSYMVVLYDGICNFKYIVIYYNVCDCYEVFNFVCFVSSEIDYLILENLFLENE